MISLTPVEVKFENIPYMWGCSFSEALIFNSQALEFRFSTKDFSNSSHLYVREEIEVWVPY